MFSATRAVDARACVVVVPSPAGDAERAAAAFAEMERVHALLDHPVIPKVSGRGVVDATPYLELDCDAVADGVEIHGRLLDAGSKVPHAAAAGIVESLGEAMQSAHAVIDPRRGRSVCLGRVSLANILFSARGGWYWIGYGQNFPHERAGGERDTESVVYQAPEVAIGGEPTPTGDLVALWLLERSYLPMIEVSAPLARALSGDPRPRDRELLEFLSWMEQHFVGAPLHLRRSIEEAKAVMARIHALSGVTPDRQAMAALVAGLLGPPAPAPAAEAASSLLLGFEVRWIAGADGVRHTVGQALGRIVTALVDRHGEAPNASLLLQDLLKAGWPGERPLAEAGANRVYVALTQLRRMGLRGILERDERGYRLAPQTVVRLVAPDAERAPSRGRRRAM